MKNRLPVIYFARLFFSLVSLLHDPWRSSDGLSEIRITARHIQNSGRSLLNLGWHGEHAQRSHKSLEFVSNFPSSPFPLKMKGMGTRSRTFTVCCACCASTQSSTHSCGCFSTKFTCCVFASCTQIFAARQAAEGKIKSSRGITAGRASLPSSLPLLSRHDAVEIIHYHLASWCLNALRAEEKARAH